VPHPPPPRHPALSLTSGRSAEMHLFDKARALLRYKWAAAAAFAAVLSAGGAAGVLADAALSRLGPPAHRARGRTIAGDGRGGQHLEDDGIHLRPRAVLSDAVPHPHGPRAGRTRGEGAGPAHHAGPERLGAPSAAASPR
jgi:hypothetical protein